MADPERLVPDSPCFVLINAGSGKDDSDATIETMRKVLRERGQRHEFMRFDDAAKLRSLAEQKAQLARERGGALVIVGGDGTINGALRAALDHQCLFAVVPSGTFNYFGRAHGISEVPEEATRQFLDGRVRAARVALVGDRPFVVNASIGLYPELLEDRERVKARLGRSRLVAFFAAIGTFLREHRQLALEIERDGVNERRRSSTLVVGNNELQMEQLGIDAGPGDGRLTAVSLAATGTLGTVGLLASAAWGRLGQAASIDNFSFERLRVNPGLPYGRRRLKVAVDGEVFWQETPLDFRVAPRALRLLCEERGEPHP